MSRDKILIVDDEQAIRDLLQLLIEVEFDNPIVFAASGKEAQKILVEDQDIGVILSDYNMPDGNGGELYLYNDTHDQLPFIMITGGFLEDYPEMKDFTQRESYFTAFITKPFEEDFLFTNLKKALAESGNTADSQLTKPISQYIAVNVNIIERLFDGLKVELFLKLPDQKFVKIFSRNTVFEAGDLVKYREKGVNNLYLLREEFERIKREVMQDIFSKLSQARSVDEVADAAGDALKFVISGAKVLGIKEEQIELIESSVESALRVLEGVEELEKLLRPFEQQEGYLVSHSITTMHIAYMILKKAKLYSKENMERLCYASLLHDCILETDQLAQILERDSDELKKLDYRQQKFVLQHPIEMAKIVEGVEQIPAESAQIILQHHEKPDGDGFPRGIGQGQFSVLSAIFILSLRVADLLYYVGDDAKQLKVFVDDLKAHYAQAAFKTPYKALLDIIS